MQYMGAVYQEEPVFFRGPWKLKLETKIQDKYQNLLLFSVFPEYFAVEEK